MRIITEDIWYHLQKVLSWISSGLLIERAGCSRDKGQRGLKPLASALQQRRPPCPSTSSPVRSFHSRVSIYRCCWRRHLAWPSRVLTSWPLVIPEPFTQLVKQHLRVTNPHGQPVAFKVKTTAPKVSRSNLAQRGQSFTRIYPIAILCPSKLGQDRTRRKHRSTR